MRTTFHFAFWLVLAALLGQLAICPRTALAEEVKPTSTSPPPASTPIAERTYVRCGLDRPTQGSRWVRTADPQPCAAPPRVTNPAAWQRARIGPGRCDYGPWFDDCCWGGSLSVLGWLPGMSGTLGAGPADIDVDISVGDMLENLGDIIEKLEFAWQGAASVRWGRWTLGLYVSGLKFGETIPLTAGGAALDAQATVLQWQANLYYRVGMSQLSCSRCPTLLVYEPYVGVRGYSTESDIRTPRPSILVEDDWVDPVVGARLTLDFRNRWALEAEGDIGGFGVGSDFSWLLRIGAGWRFHRNWYFRFGWMFVDTDYESGTGLNRFKWDLHQSGPYLALDLVF